MKNKIIMIALAATVSLGACTDRYSQSGMSNKQQTGYTSDGYNRSDMSYKQTGYTSDGTDLSRRDVRKVQRSLAADGFYKGRIDGIWGEQTSQAILEYQSAHQQPRTGSMTVETLQEFGIRMDEEHHRSKNWPRERG